MSSRKEKSKDKKKSKPSIFKDNKKRSRSESIPNNGQMEERVVEQQTQSGKPPKSLTTWKSLPRPSKTSISHSSSHIPVKESNKSKISARRSLYVLISIMWVILVLISPFLGVLMKVLILYLPI